MEHREAELRAVEPCDVPDDPVRFLRELRQLRNEAGLGHAELAARAHYPGDTIRVAEAGPALPDLPVLSAYVRGCGGAVAEWEERWRALTRSPASPLLSVRPAGVSDAATAGARVGATSLAADGHDPDVIMAALNRVADGIAADSPSGPGAESPAAVSLFGASEPGSASAPFMADSAAVAVAPAGPGTALAAEDADRPAPGMAPWESTPPEPGADGPHAAAPSPAAPAPAMSRDAGARRPFPPKPLIAALAALVLCLVATILALFALPRISRGQLFAA